MAPWFLSPGLLLDRVRAEAAQLDMPVASAIAAPVPTPH
ncbi:Conserved hypothetical protein (cobalamin biosynthesis?) [Mycobacteroides abscessus]|nr:Conserved hypothetical protein (cobalamin biosynthesis?) [Mycobacteroides abscessus]